MDRKAKEQRGQGRRPRDLTKLIDRYSGSLDSRGELRAQVAKLRKEWR